MKFRNRFLRFGAPVLNDVLTLGSYAPTMFNFADGDGGDDGGGGDGGDGGSNDNTDDKPVTLTAEQFNKLISNQKPPADKPPEKGAFDKIEEERTNQKTEAEKVASTRKTVAFDMSFNGFVDKNKDAFTIDVDKFRESTKGLEGEELERTLSVTAAKDFFRKDENINLLPERDREYIKTGIIGLADNAIDYRKAFQLIEDALHVKARIAENGQYRKNSNTSNIDNVDTPNVTDYLKKCAEAGKPKTAA